MLHDSLNGHLVLNVKLSAGQNLLAAPSEDLSKLLLFDQDKWRPHISFLEVISKKHRQRSRRELEILSSILRRNFLANVNIKLLVHGVNSSQHRELLQPPSPPVPRKPPSSVFS